MLPILMEVMEITGLKLVLFCGGPMPHLKGEVSAFQ